MAEIPFFFSYHKTTIRRGTEAGRPREKLEKARALGGCICICIREKSSIYVESTLFRWTILGLGFGYMATTHATEYYKL